MFKVGEKVYLARNIGEHKKGTMAFVQQTKRNKIILRVYADDEGISVRYTDILKVCPSCGCKPELEIDLEGQYVEVTCSLCNAVNIKMDVSVYYTAFDDAIRCWNKKAKKRDFSFLII